ncbi:MAG: rhodanese-like domain-containing protein [Chloroflexi bacterium]|nr:rhodanese-like domain-containing protein [Chloroflexota bacterium]
MAKKRTTKRKTSRSKRKQSVFDQAWFKFGLIGVAVLIVALIVASNNTQPTAATLPTEINVDQAYQRYNEGTFLLDVRTIEEWNEYHIPNTTLIPLDELPDRLDEVPRDQMIVVVCRSGNRSQIGRDILLQAGFEQVASMAGGVKTWRASGYPIETGP